MNTVRSVGIALVAGVLLLLPRISVAQEAGKDKEMKPQQNASEQEMMKKWLQVSTPGEPQKRLDALEGTWNVEMKIWSRGPSNPPSISKGTSLKTWVLGNRYLREEYKGDMMNMPFDGLGYTGYDNYNKRYFGFWIDNSTTQMLSMTGVMDTSAKTLTLYGTMDEWMTGENGKPAKYVTRILGKDKHMFEIHDLAIDGPNTTMMEATYTRKK